MTFDLWKKTGIIKPFETVEEYDEWITDCVKAPKLDPFINSPLRKSKIKKGFGDMGEKFDSEWEYIVSVYYRKVKGMVVERNKSQFVTYLDEKCVPRKWFFDFLIGGEKYEVKGRFTAKDILKMQQYPEIKFIVNEDIKHMKEELNKLFGNSWNNYVVIS